MLLFTDTIAAIATATGAAGVGMVRLSGATAFTLADKILRHKKPTHRYTGHTLHRATVHDPATDELLDDALIAVFHAPHSFTGENVVEIQGHGGTVLLSRVLQAVLTAGARPARPGEFTERAFLNGKIDLAQAEAISDLVSAKTVAAQRAARRQVSGELSRLVTRSADALKEALAVIEASIDFPEDVGEADPVVLHAIFHRALAPLESLLAGAGYGRRLQEGITVVLTGRPNVGKSSLLNALSGTERAIVTAVPGTTRDVVEESLNLHGIPVRALDTAGLRDTEDVVEAIGVERARQATETADIVIAVLSATDPLTDADTALLRSLAHRPAVIALNKADTADTTVLKSVIRTFVPETVPLVETVAPTRSGLSALTDALVRVATGSDGSTLNETTPLVTSARHTLALESARAALYQAREALDSFLPLELIAVDVHGAMQSLGEITGETAREEIIAGIFARFCIGK